MSEISSCFSYRTAFEEKKSLGSGSFSTVFEVVDKNKCSYAVKKVPFNLQDYGNTLKEIDILRNLNNIYVAKHIYSWIEPNYYIGSEIFGDNSDNLLNSPNNDHLLHIQMELYQANLMDIIKGLRYVEKNKVSLYQYKISCGILIQLLEGLNYLHEQIPPIIHRDLKPQNIMISTNSGDNIVKVADFGLSTYHKYVDVSLTKYKGTPQFRAPEVDLTTKYTTKVDIYSIGRIIQMLFNMDINESLSLDHTIEKKYSKLIKITIKCLSHLVNNRPDCRKILNGKNFWAIDISDNFIYEILNIVDQSRDELLFAFKNSDNSSSLQQILPKENNRKNNIDPIDKIKKNDVMPHSFETIDNLNRNEFIKLRSIPIDVIKKNDVMPDSRETKDNLKRNEVNNSRREPLDNIKINVVITDSCGPTDNINRNDVNNSTIDPTDNIKINVVMPDSRESTDNLNRNEVNNSRRDPIDNIKRNDVMPDSREPTDTLNRNEVNNSRRDPIDNIKRNDVMPDSREPTDNLNRNEVNNSRRDPIDNIKRNDVMPDSREPTDNLNRNEVNNSGRDPIDNIKRNDVMPDSREPTDNLNRNDVNNSTIDPTDNIKINVVMPDSRESTDNLNRKSIKSNSINKTLRYVDALKVYEQNRIKWHEERIHIHKKTFTNYINSFLRNARMEVNDIFIDLADGRCLLKLLEIISGEKLKPQRGRMRVHMLENVNKSLAFLHSKVRLESIGAEDIVDGNKQLILGLIWTIILRFHIQDIEIDVDLEKSEKKKGIEALFLWCKRKTVGYPNVNVCDFTQSWRSGMAFNALIHAHRPDIIDYNNLNPHNHIETLNNAFDTAQRELAVPKILDAEDMDIPVAKSIMIYVSLYYHTFARMSR